MAQPFNALMYVLRMKAMVFETEAELQRVPENDSTTDQIPHTSGTRRLLFVQLESQERCLQTLSLHFVCTQGRDSASAKVVQELFGHRRCWWLATWHGFTMILFPVPGWTIGGLGAFALIVAAVVISWEIPQMAKIYKRQDSTKYYVTTWLHHIKKAGRQNKCYEWFTLFARAVLSCIGYLCNSCLTKSWMIGRALITSFKDFGSSFGGSSVHSTRERGEHTCQVVAAFRVSWVLWKLEKIFCDLAVRTQGNATERVSRVAFGRNTYTPYGTKCVTLRSVWGPAGSLSAQPLGSLPWHIWQYERLKSIRQKYARRYIEDVLRRSKSSMSGWQPGPCPMRMIRCALDSLAGSIIRL